MSVLTRYCYVAMQRRSRKMNRLPILESSARNIDRKTLDQYNLNYPTHSDFSILRVVFLAIEQPSPPCHLLLSEKTWNWKVELVREVIWNNAVFQEYESREVLVQGSFTTTWSHGDWCSVPCLLYQNISENSDWVENLRIHIPKQERTVNNWITSIQPSNNLGGF